MLLLEYARAQGLKMGGVHRGQHVGFTTDEDRAERVRQAGARVITCYNATGPKGWEIVFPLGAEAVAPTIGTAA